MRRARHQACVSPPGPQRGRRRARSRRRRGKPYSVFSPFHRRLARGRRAATCSRRRASCRRCRRDLAKGRVPPLDSLGLSQEVAEPARGGEAEARKALDRFLAGPIRDYVDDHDALGRDNTSRLSPYLHFGCVSVRAIEERLPRGKAAEAFRRQLCWRDFYHHVLHHFPRNAKSEFQDRYRGSITLELREAALRGVVRGPHRLSRWSTRACASCAERAGCTTAPGSSSARF